MKPLQNAIYTLLMLLPASAAFAQKPGGPSLADLVARVTATENEFVDELANYRPLVETYIQYMKEAGTGGSEIENDVYFVGNFEFRRGIEYQAFNPERSFGLQPFALFKTAKPRRLLPDGFAQMAVIDSRDFSPAAYDFENPHGEFLGDVRCIVLDVKPKPKSGSGRFVGRVWVEDRGYHVVRFSGIYTPKLLVRYLHFNSYREQMGPGLWLPSITYVEESFSKDPRRAHVDLKGHVRFWGYRSGSQRAPETFTDILVDTPEPPRDSSSPELSGTQALRQWQRQAEDNTVQRMEKAGLIGAEGEVEEVLNTVLNNLLVTNKVVVEPPVRARVLLTTPLESFTIGHTIVLSRGLIDVLPSEASLAAVIARELGGILLGFKGSTANAFSDRMLFGDDEILRRLAFERTSEQDLAANRRGVELLQHSPYAAQLPGVGLFLRALAARVNGVPSLLKARIGNPVAGRSGMLLLPELMAKAPQLDHTSTTQIAALPLGSRVRLDPWSNQTGMIKTRPVALLSAREKLPFEVMPVVINLKRQQKVVTTAADLN